MFVTAMSALPPHLVKLHTYMVVGWYVYRYNCDFVLLRS